MENDGEKSMEMEGNAGDFPGTEDPCMSAVVSSLSNNSKILTARHCKSTGDSLQAMTCYLSVLKDSPSLLVSSVILHIEYISPRILLCVPKTET